MRAAVSTLLASVVIAAGTCLATASAQTAMQLFPTEQTPTPSGSTATISVGRGAADTLKITPVKFLSKPGTNAGEGSKSMCGLIVAPHGAAIQSVVTVGTGVTEATPSCDAVLAIGAVPPARGEQTRRIGVIHAISSRNAVDGRAAVVLHRVAGRWQVDDAATTRADTVSHYTIAELRRIL